MGRPWRDVGAGLIVPALAGAVIVFAVFAVEPRPAGWIPVDRARRIGEFRLTDAVSGAEVSGRDFSGKWLVVSAVLTGCGTTCLRVSRNVSELQRRLGDAGDVRLISVTVDPRTDSAGVLGQFAARHGARPGRWYFLTGAVEVVRPLVERMFPTGEPLPGLSGVGPLPAATERLAVVDSAGVVRGYVDGLSAAAPGVVLKVLEQHQAWRHP